jgi:glutamine amidotransferase-like uncharacterized protein
MIFKPVINRDNEARGIQEFDVANVEGVWLGTVRVSGKHAEFMPHMCWLLSDQLIAVARFMREKTDAK